MADIKITAELEAGSLIGGLNALAQTVSAKANDAGNALKNGIGNSAKQAGDAIRANLTKGLEESTGKFKETFSEIGKTAAGIFTGGALLAGGAGVVEVFKGIWESGERAIERTEKLDLALSQAGLNSKQSAAEMTRMSTAALDMSNRFSVAKEHVQETQQQVALLGGVTGKQNDDITKLTVGIEKMSGGMISGTQIIRAFTKGVGDQEAEASIGRLKTMFPALATALKDVTSPAEMTQKALAYFGPGFEKLEEQSAGPIGSMNRFRNTLSSVQEKIGVLLVGAFAPLLEGLGGVATALQDGLSFVQRYSDVFLVLGGIIAGVAIAVNAETIAEGAKSLAMGIQTAIYMTATQAAVAHAAAVKAGTAAEGSATVATGLLNTVLAMNPIALVVIGLAALVAGLILAYNHFTVVRATVNAVGAAFGAFWETIKAIGAGVGHVIHGMFTLNLGEITDGIAGATKAYALAAVNIGTAAKESFDKTYADANKATESGTEKVEDQKAKVIDLKAEAASIGTAFSEGMKAAKAALSENEGEIAGLIQKMRGASSQEERARYKQELADKIKEARAAHKTITQDEADQNRAKSLSGDVKSTKHGGGDAHAAELKRLQEYLDKRNAAQLSARRKELADLEIELKAQEDKLKEDVKKKTLTQSEADAFARQFTENARTQSAAINKKFDDAEVKRAEEEQKKIADALAKKQAEQKKNAETVAKDVETAQRTHRDALIDLMVDGGNKEIARLAAANADKIAAIEEEAEKELDAQKKLLADKIINEQEYQKIAAVIGAKSALAEKDQNALAKKASVDAHNKDNVALQAFTAQGQAIQQQGFQWIDDRMAASAQNQKTVAFGLQQSLIGSLKTYLAQRVGSLLTSIGVELGIVETTEGAKKTSYLATAGAAISAAATTVAGWASAAAGAVAHGAIIIAHNIAVGASAVAAAATTVAGWAAAAAGAVVHGAIIIAQNIAVGASAVAAAAASAVAWLVSTLGPFGALGAVGIVAAIIAEWSNIRKTLGFGKGGMGLVGEGGGMEHAEVIAPLKDFSEFMGMAAREIASSIMVATHEPKARAAHSVGGDFAGEMKKLGDRIERVQSNVNFTIKQQGKMIAKGTELHQVMDASISTQQAKTG